jgi:hypothetical protein
VIVGAQQDQDIFRGDHQEQRPDDQRQDAEHHRFVGRIAGADRRQHRFTQRVERAGADVTVDDADAAERQRPESDRGRRFAAVGGSGSCGNSVWRHGIFGLKLLQRKTNGGGL